MNSVTVKTTLRYCKPLLNLACNESPPAVMKWSPPTRDGIVVPSWRWLMSS